MRKIIALKQLLRAPLKAILTFLLIAAASFALFSRAMDYTVTLREIRNAISFYHGTAALDNTVPDVIMIDSVGDNIGVGTTYETEDKPWPSQEQLERFSSLPGAALTDHRYMTAGLVGDYKRLVDKDNMYNSDGFVLEGTYQGYEDAQDTQDYIYIKMDNVKVLAGDLEYNQGEMLKMTAGALEDYVYWTNPYPRAYWEGLEIGSRCLMVGSYSALNGMQPQLGSMDGGGNTADVDNEEMVCVLDGLPDNYLETEEFAFYQELIEKYRENLKLYDIVYTSDMRAIPRFNERNMVITQGRPLVEGDDTGCVVNERFLGAYGLSVGDKISIQMGDRLLGQNVCNGSQLGFGGKRYQFVGSAELEIIGAYKFVDTYDARCIESEWGYTINSIFVPSSLLPVEVPADYETRIGEFSVLVEDAQDIEAFLEASEPLVTEMGVNMRFSDGGWMKIKDSFEIGARTAFLTMALYVLGAALALLLAVYLYVGRNKKAYAVMRTLGVPVRKAQDAVVLPLVLLSVLAVPAGGIAGLLYAKGTVNKALQSMMESAPYGYVLDTRMPAGVIFLCLLLELAFTLCVTLVSLRKMKKIPPLELLQDNAFRAGEGKKRGQEPLEPVPVPLGAGIAGLALEEIPVGGAGGHPRRKYRALRQVPAYILRHMRRSLGKTAVSFGLSVVLAAGLGLFVMAQIAYQDTFYEIDVKGKAMGYSSESIRKIEESNLIRDLYYHGDFYVRVDRSEEAFAMVCTNGLERYMADHAKEYQVTYAEGYGASSLEGGEPLCLLGKELAKESGYAPGDQIPLLADNVYESMYKNFGDAPQLLETRLKYATKMYTVAGIVDSDDTEITSSVFALASPYTERLFCQPFQLAYSDFMLADNERADYVNRFMEEIRTQDYYCGQTASFYIDTEALKGIGRVCGLLEQLFPVAVAAASLIGLFGPGLVILQSAREAAYLRILGVTKKRCRCILVLEQAALCILGALLAAGGLALSNQGRFLRGGGTLAACAGVYLLGSILGALVASVLVTRHKALELLHGKE